MVLLTLIAAMIPIAASGQDNSDLLEALNRIKARLNAIEHDDDQEIDKPRVEPIEPIEPVEESVPGVEEREIAEPDILALNDDSIEKQEDSVAFSNNPAVNNAANNAVNNIEDLLEFNESVELYITGFGNIYFASYQDALGNGFSVGELEVDLETSIADKTVLGAAIAYDPETESFGLGAFTMDFHFWDREGGHFNPVNGIDHSGFIAGLFDVPFGLDWNVYSSIDRKLVSAPLTVESTHDGWNDYGVQFYADNQYFNGVVYGTNGFFYEWTDKLGDPVEVEMKFAAGGRLGINVTEQLELGGSYGSFFNEDSKLDMDLKGADVIFYLNNFSAKGEYISHRIAAAATDGVTNSGYYVQGLYDFSGYYFVARYDAFKFDGAIEETIRMSIGAGWAINERSDLKFEYQVNSGDGDDVSYLQIVAGF